MIDVLKARSLDSLTSPRTGLGPGKLIQERLTRAGAADVFRSVGVQMQSPNHR